MILDTDKGNEGFNGFSTAEDNAKMPRHTCIVYAKAEAPEIKRNPGHIMPRSLAEFFRVIPALDKADIVRLHGLTGGIPAIAKELDTTLSYEDNLKRLLGHGSAFSDFLPAVLTELFRSPDSYHPLMYQIALGKHRLSKIAKAAGFPNNKCGKYLEALTNVGLVEAVRKRPTDMHVTIWRTVFFIAGNSVLTSNCFVVVSEAEINNSSGTYGKALTFLCRCGTIQLSNTVSKGASPFGEAPFLFIGTE